MTPQANGNGHDPADRRQDPQPETLEALGENVRLAILAARTAANAALEASAACATLRREMLDAMAEQTTEILRLVGSDAAHRESLKRLDAHARRVTETATNAIVAQADRSGRALSRKITIPVGTISAIAVLVQYLLAHFAK